MEGSSREVPPFFRNRKGIPRGIPKPINQYNMKRIFFTKDVRVAVSSPYGNSSPC